VNGRGKAWPAGGAGGITGEAGAGRKIGTNASAAGRRSLGACLMSSAQGFRGGMMVVYGYAALVALLTRGWAIVPDIDGCGRCPGRADASFTLHCCGPWPQMVSGRAARSPAEDFETLQLRFFCRQQTPIAVVGLGRCQPGRIAGRRRAAQIPRVQSTKTTVGAIPGRKNQKTALSLPALAAPDPVFIYRARRHYLTAVPTSDEAKDKLAILVQGGRG